MYQITYSRSRTLCVRYIDGNTNESKRARHFKAYIDVSLFEIISQTIRLIIRG